MLKAIVSPLCAFCKAWARETSPVAGLRLLVVVTIIVVAIIGKQKQNTLAHRPIPKTNLLISKVRKGNRENPLNKLELARVAKAGASQFASRDAVKRSASHTFIDLTRRRFFNLKVLRNERAFGPSGIARKREPPATGKVGEKAGWKIRARRRKHIHGAERFKRQQ